MADGEDEGEHGFPSDREDEGEHGFPSDGEDKGEHGVPSKVEKARHVVKYAKAKLDDAKCSYKPFLEEQQTLDKTISMKEVVFARCKLRFAEAILMNAEDEANPNATQAELDESSRDVRYFTAKVRETKDELMELIARKREITIATPTGCKESTVLVTSDSYAIVLSCPTTPYGSVTVVVIYGPRSRRASAYVCLEEKHPWTQDTNSFECTAPNIPVSPWNRMYGGITRIETGPAFTERSGIEIPNNTIVIGWDYMHGEVVPLNQVLTDAEAVFTAAKADNADEDDEDDEDEDEDEEDEEDPNEG